MAAPKGPKRSRPSRRASSSPLHMPSVREGRSSARGAAAASHRPRAATPSKANGSRQRTSSAPTDHSPRAAGHRVASRPTATSHRSRPTRPSRSAGTPSQSRGGRTAASYASPRIQASPFAKERRRPPVPVLVFLAVALLCGTVFAVDQLVNGSRIYQGVSVGSVDVSGMTADEARTAVSAAYGEHLAQGRGVIFASDEAAATVDVGTALAEQEAQAEQLSVEEARENKLLWIAEAGALGARVPVSELVDEAFSVGRAGGVFERLAAATGGVNVPVRLAFDDEAVEALAADIDETIGEPRQDWDVAVGEDGRARLVEGHDGTIVDRSQFVERLTEGFLGDNPAGFAFVASVGYAPLRIDEAAAERTRAAVQTALDRGVSFSFEGSSWTLSGAEAAPWMATEVRSAGEGFALAPVIDEKRARADLLQRIRDAGFASAVTVSFERTEGDVWVSAAEGSRYPLVAEALDEAREALFGAFDRTGQAEGGTAPVVAIGWGAAPARTTFDEAVDLGLVGEIASFTTEYNDGAGTANRRHNIHHAADRLTDSIAKANGGTWSFNEVMGEANEANGFQAAHAIVNGEYEDAIGGGICQVATTVFNAVFESGFPVTERRNHSLYISSYPTGRDAAIAYPDLDLKWVNDGTSDVLLRCRYTSSSLTVSLFGIDPGYTVTAETGDWAPGDPYKKRTKVDESEPEGTRYVKTAGADGRRVTVHRTVRDRDGTVRHEEDFPSNYAPIDEVTVVGPNTPAADEDRSEEEQATTKEDARVSTGD